MSTVRANQTLDDLLRLLRNHRVLSFEESDRIADKVERLRKVEGRALRVVTTSHDPACSRGDIDLAIEALAEVLGRD